MVVGSYTQKTTSQLESLLELSTTTPVEVSVDKLASGDGRSREVQRAATEARKAIEAGSHAVVFTSRALESALGRAGDLAAGAIVTASLVGIVRSLDIRPRFVIAKGGIT